MRYLSNYQYSDFARRKGSKDKKKRTKKSLAGTAAKALGGAALLAAGTRYGGAALLKRNQGASRLAYKGLGKVYQTGEKLAGSKYKIAQNLGNKLQQGAEGAGYRMAINDGARATLRSDLSKIGNAVKDVKEKAKSMMPKKKNKKASSAKSPPRTIPIE